MHVYIYTHVENTQAFTFGMASMWLLCVCVCVCVCVIISVKVKVAECSGAGCCSALLYSSGVCSYIPDVVITKAPLVNLL